MSKTPPHRDFSYEHEDLTEIARKGIDDLRSKNAEESQDRDRLISETEEALRKGGMA